MKSVASGLVRLLLLPSLLLLLGALSAGADSPLHPPPSATDIGLPPLEACHSEGSAGTPYATGVNCRLKEVDGYPRAFIVYVPENVQDPAPVVFMFHGSGGTGAQFYAMSGRTWTVKADEEGIIAVFPTGVEYCKHPAGFPGICNWVTKWNSYYLPEEEQDGFDFDVRPPGYPPEPEAPFPADDVGFTNAVLDDLIDPANGLSVDTEQIFASGFSSGAGLVGRLAVEMADRLAAVGYTSAGLVKVDDPAHLPLPPVAHIPVYAAFGGNEDGIREKVGWDPAWGELPLNPHELLAICGLVDYFIVPHLDGLGHDYDAHTLWPFTTVENVNSTQVRWHSPQAGGPQHLFLMEVLAGLTHHWPRGFDAEKNPNAFVAADMFWAFFQDPSAYLNTSAATPASSAMVPECPAGATTGDYGDAPDDSNTPGINPNTAYDDSGVSGTFPTTWPDLPAGPVHFQPQVFLGDDFSLEVAADVGPDPDGANNIVDGPADNADNDGFDDGWLNPDALFPHCQRTTLKVRVSRAADAAAVPDRMFLNVWFDGNRDGDWADHFICPNVVAHPRAGEWIVRNQVINAAAIPPGGYVDLDVNTFRIPNQAGDLSHWIRFTLSESPMPTTAGQMPDGRGPQDGHQMGETEDHLYEPSASGAPGNLVLTQEFVPSDPSVPGDVTDIVIGLEQVGGGGPAASQITDLLPQGFSFVGPIAVQTQGLGAAPLLVTYDAAQDLISWQGRIAPNSRLLISIPVRVGACFGAGTRQITNVVAAEQTDGSQITADAAMTVACLPVGLDDLSVERKLFLGDVEVMAGADGVHVILDGADDSVTLHTSVTNNGSHPVRLGLVDVLEYHEGGLNTLASPTMDPASTAEKDHVAILRPGQTRTFIQGDPLGLFDKDRQWDDLLGESRLVSRLTYCLLEFKDQPCPDPVANPDLVADVEPIVILLARRDLGDAPDSSNNVGLPMMAYANVPASFPTVRNPATGLPPGPVHVTPRPFHLGQRVSLEGEADVGPDQDPSNNILPAANMANRDRADDGIRPGLLSFSHCQPVTFQARVFISPAAVAYFANQDADGLANLNAWLDGNGNGHWRDAVDCPPEAPEHIVIDQEIDPVALGPGLNTINVTSGPVPWARNACAWLRITLSDRPAEKPLSFGNVSYGDGRGDDSPYISGETEDYLVCPGGPGNPDLDVKLTGRPAFPANVDGPPGERDLLMDAVEQFLFRATYANLGSGTAAGTVLSVTSLDGNGNDVIVEELYITDPDGQVRAGESCSVLSDCDLELGDIAPGESGAVLIRTSVQSSPSDPTAQLTAQVQLQHPLDGDTSNNSATLELDQGPALFAPTINSVLVTNGFLGRWRELSVQGTAQPASTVELTLERLSASAPITPTDLVAAGGTWSFTFQDLPPDDYRVYAVTRSGDERSPRSNEYLLSSGGTIAGYFRLTDDAGRQRVIDLNNDPFMKLKPGETYRIATCVGTDDPDLQIVQWLPEINDEVLLAFVGASSTAPCYLYEGQFTVPADQVAAADEGVEATPFYFALIGDSTEVIRAGLMAVEDRPGRVSDVDTGQPLVGASVTALERREGVVASRMANLLQPWVGAPFNHPNPVFTAEDGAYQFLVPDGDYHLQVTQPGYQPYLSPMIGCAYPLCGGVLSEALSLTQEIRRPADTVLTMNDSGFTPSQVRIWPGAVVEWVNMGLKEHSAAAASSASTQWSSGLLRPGQSYKRRFGTRGTYIVLDGSNPANSVTIIVEGAPPIYLPVVVR